MGPTISKSGPAEVEILELSTREPNSEQLSHVSISAPKPGADGTAAGPYSFDFEGWVIGRDERVVAVDLMEHGFTAQRIPMNTKSPELAERYPDSADTGFQGFFKRVNALKFPPRFELSIEAVFPDEEHVEVGRLRGVRSTLPPGPEDQLQPLMITTLGRSGSTAVINLLAAHPQIVAYRPTETETRVASYWMDVFVQLADPSSYMRMLYPRGLAKGWWLGDAGVTPRMNEDPETREWLAIDAVEELAAICRGRIEAFYREFVGAVGKTDAIYFTEKCQPRVGQALSGYLGEIYPRAREIVLVRDFRDMICSMLAYKKGKAFARPNMSRKENIENLGDSALNLLHNWQRRADQAHLMRYEDLMLDPASTIESLLRYLDLDASEKAVEDSLSVFSASGRKLEYHRTTSAKSNASIGRWRNDLGPRRLKQVEDAFGPALEGFGYA